MRQCRRERPFEILGIVLMPDHLHTLWRLPDGDSAYPARIGWLKKEFAKSWVAQGGVQQSVRAARRGQRRLGVWQPRSWEHAIRDTEDHARHMDYIHFNPVKHGHAACAADWPWSSFHRSMRAGVYPADWGCLGFRVDEPEHGLGEPGC